IRLSWSYPTSIKLGRARLHGDLSGIFLKRLRGRFLVVEHFKNSEQLGDLEQIAYPLAQARQFYRTAGVPGGRVQRNQRSEPAAIDMIHFSQIHHYLRALCQEFL